MSTITLMGSSKWGGRCSEFCQWRCDLHQDVQNSIELLLILLHVKFEDGKIISFLAHKSRDNSGGAWAKWLGASGLKRCLGPLLGQMG
jgi:hypothetical protein